MTDDSDAIVRELKILNKKGLHARASAKFVQCVDRFECEVFVLKDGQSVSGTSIMGLMMLAAGRGSQIRVTVKGAGASQLVSDLEALFARKFDEV